VAPRIGWKLRDGVDAGDVEDPTNELERPVTRQVDDLSAEARTAGSLNEGGVGTAAIGFFADTRYREGSQLMPPSAGATPSHEFDRDAQHRLFPQPDSPSHHQCARRCDTKWTAPTMVRLTSAPHLTTPLAEDSPTQTLAIPNIFGTVGDVL
jgi:hypothetical protein